MRILIVEDSVEEQQRAQEAVEEAGHEAVHVTSDLRYGSSIPWEPIYSSPDYKEYKRQMLGMEECDGVLTDLHFLPVQDQNTERENEMYGDNLPPCGLLVVIDALTHGKPVVVCTSGNHHGATMSFIFDRYLQNLGRTEAFGWNDGKNWGEAVRQLEERYQAGQAE